MTESDPLIGRVFGNVRLTARLGAGAMGVVYRAHHEHIGTDVAVKFLAAGQGERSRERFLREGRAAAKVTSDHMVQVLDAGLADGTAYLVMELVNGHSLGRILDEHGALPAEAVARLGAGIALGLAAIHARAIVHRDIKPDNILVGTDGRPKIADLGLAKQLDNPELLRLTGTGMVVGTPLYVAPEVIRDPENVTIKADIYSLGVTLFHLASGRPPFDHSTPYEVMRAHLEQKPKLLSEVKPGVIPAALSQIVDRCLLKNPASRPSALDVADVLGQLAQGGIGQQRKRRRWPLLIAAAVMLAVVVGGGAWWWRQQQQPTPVAVIDPATAATLRVQVNHPQVEGRIDDGAWQSLSALTALHDESGWRVAPGARQVTVRATQGGAELAWHGTVTLNAGETRALPIELASTPVKPVAVPVTGSGMLFVDGVAFGTDAAATFAAVGRYAVARWDGALWQALEVTVNSEGRVSASTPGTHDHPDGAAFWRTVGDDGQPVPPWHLACWWEVDRARDATRASAPAGWEALGVTPEQPATRAGPLLAGAYAQWLGAAVARLPTREAALRLSLALRAPVWCGEATRPELAGGQTMAAAVIVVVPP